MQTLSSRPGHQERSKIGAVLIGLGLTLISAIFIQQVLAQNVVPTLKPPFRLNPTHAPISSVIVPDPPLDAPILISETFGSSYTPTGDLTAVGWHQVTGTEATIGYTWGRVTTGPHPNSAWVAATRLSGEPALTPGTSPYTNGMESLLIYGPLDLSNYGTAVLSATYFLDVRPGDWFGVAASTDGTNFNAVSAETSVDPSVAVAHTTIYDLKPYARQPSVWVGFYFKSNTDNIVGRGAFVDEVVVRGVPLTKVYMPIVAKELTPTPTVTPFLYNYTFGSGASNDPDFLKWGGARTTSCGTACTYTQSLLSSIYGNPGGAMTIYVDQTGSIGGASPNVQATTNYEYAVDFNVYNGQKDARYGLIFAASQFTFNPAGSGVAFDPSRNYYKLELQFSKTDKNVIAFYQLHECVNGTCGAITSQGNLPGGVVPGQWNTVKVRHQSNNFTIYFNGVQLATATGSSTWDTVRRKFGVYLETRGTNNVNGPFEVFFDNVQITALP